MLIERTISSHVKRLAKQYPVITLTGPRQSGKTTLCKMLFPEKSYVTLENPDNRQFAIQDARGFLSRYPDGAIIDEVQRCPDLLSYIQGIVDDHKIPGEFIVTGSAQFELLGNISQSLAGRTAIVKLLPFTYEEVYRHTLVDLDILLFKGFFPRIHDQNLEPSEAYQFYFETYIERDVKNLLKIKDQSMFERFVRLCAGRSGQILNMANLAVDVGTSVNTIKSWISVLEASFLVLLLQPHSANFRKRLVKSPKLYFLDTGLACSLLGINKADQLTYHPLRGAIFESYAIAELLKRRFNSIKRNNLYYFRENNGHEVDVIIDNGIIVQPVEIKSSKTIHQDFFKGLDYYCRLNTKTEKPALVFAGTENQQRTKYTVYSYRSIEGVDNPLPK